MKLYKYSKREFADNLLKSGIIRIGTLHDFRRKEHAQRSDPNEGKLNESFQVIEDQFTGESELASPYRGVFAFGPDAKKACVSLRDSKITHHSNYPDAYVLCLSSKHCTSLRDKFGGVGLCVSDTQALVTILTKSLSEKDGDILQPLVGPVEYRARDIHTKQDGNNFRGLQRPHPAFVKDPSYAEEAEFRIFWPVTQARTLAAVLLREKALRGLFAESR